MQWQNADAEVRRVRQMHERARAQGRLPTERVGHTVTLVAEVSSHVFRCICHYDAHRPSGEPWIRNMNLINVPS